MSDAKDIKSQPVLSAITPVIVTPPATTRLDQLVGFAQIYKSLGFVPIGVRGKVPVAKGWQNTKMSEAIDIIKALGSKINNVGIVAGKASNIVVVDIDLRENGIANWHKLVQTKGVPETFVVQTGSGGYHYYFQYDERMPMLHNGKVSGMGIDFKTDAGQVVGPGSIHPDNNRVYNIVAGYKDGKASIARMPDWLYELIMINQKS